MSLIENGHLRVIVWVVPVFCAAGTLLVTIHSSGRVDCPANQLGYGVLR